MPRKRRRSNHTRKTRKSNRTRKRIKNDQKRPRIKILEGSRIDLTNEYEDDIGDLKCIAASERGIALGLNNTFMWVDSITGRQSYIPSHCSSLTFSAQNPIYVADAPGRGLDIWSADLRLFSKHAHLQRIETVAYPERILLQNELGYSIGARGICDLEANYLRSDTHLLCEQFCLETGQRRSIWDLGLVSTWQPCTWLVDNPGSSSLFGITRTRFKDNLTLYALDPRKPGSQYITLDWNGGPKMIVGRQCLTRGLNKEIEIVPPITTSTGIYICTSEGAMFIDWRKLNTWMDMPFSCPPSFFSCSRHFLSSKMIWSVDSDADSLIVNPYDAI